MELRRLKNVYNVQGTLFMLDSTLAWYHNKTLNEDVDEDDLSDVIFGTEVGLALIMSILIESKGNNGNPIFLTQFNQDRAW